MRVVVTGASGFLGKALLPHLSAKNTIYALSRHPPVTSKNVIPIRGDITLPYLGLDGAPQGIDRVYHLAAIHHLGEDKDGSMWETNVIGTKNIIAFCHRHEISQLYFCSTAYTVDDGRNVYEKSKILCEKMVLESGIPHVTIFKPSIVMGTKENPYPGHFSQFVTLLIRTHRRAELIRRRLEGNLRLPILEPVFRVKGNADGYLNLVTIDAVAEGMSKFRKVGTYWLTNPNPPTLGQLLEWIGKSIMVNLKWNQHFRATPLEVLFQRKISAFEPYLLGDSFPSNLRNCPLITEEFIHETIINSLNIDKGLKMGYTKNNRR